MTTSKNTVWGCDVKVSMPAPVAAGEMLFDMSDGFAFTMNGLVHNMSASDAEEINSNRLRPVHVSGSHG
jgi:hypothetical protein